MKKTIVFAIILLTVFIFWTVALGFIDVQPIGPQNTCVGFATLNRWFHAQTGVHIALYLLTDWLSLLPILVATGFALLGLIQWINRKRLFKVDVNLRMLGLFYVVVTTAYCLFEILSLNYRPVLINGLLEVSYPSSTTLLVITIMQTAVIQFKQRIRNKTVLSSLRITFCAFTVFMIVSRLLSGVHWVSDIIGRLLLSEGLVLAYKAATQR